jgi:hypothetical protein
MFFFLLSICYCHPVKLTIFEELSETNILNGLFNHIFIPGSIRRFFVGENQVETLSV